MSGLDLKEMDASDFLDVIHFVFEEDMFVASKEEAEYRSDVRSSIYSNFYEREYANKLQKSSSRNYGSSSTYADGSPIGPPEDDLSDINQFEPNPVKNKTKSFIPATEVNPDSVLPFGKDIDAPLG